jgi:hypothetical protein
VGGCDQFTFGQMIFDQMTLGQMIWAESQLLTYIQLNLATIPAFVSNITDYIFDRLTLPLPVD